MFACFNSKTKENEKSKDNKKDAEKKETPFESLMRRTEITKDTRFQASLRLERRNKHSYFLISILSLFVIVLSLIPNIVDLSGPAAQALLALTIVNSVFVIITTFVEASGNFIHRSEQLHRCALQIGKVHSELTLLPEAERQNLEKIVALQEKYNLALAECPFNHENIDTQQTRISKPNLFKGKMIGNGRDFYAIIRWITHQIHLIVWMTPHILVILSTLAMLYFIISNAILTAEFPSNSC